MKLATLKDGSRDGLLAVVSRDLAQAHFASGIASRLQQLCDDWNFISPQLEDLYAMLNGGKARHAFAFDPRQCMAPLPRAYQWAELAAYPALAERLRRAPGADVPGNPGTRTQIQLGSSDHFFGPCDDATFADESRSIDIGPGLAVITGDVAMGASPGAALDGVRLLMLGNGWRLHDLDPAWQGSDFGSLQSRPAAAFGPVAVTPDELGAAWHGGRVHLEIETLFNGQRLGRSNASDAGDTMALHFGEIVAQLAKTRDVRAGSIVGSGTVSHTDTARGCHCIAEKRALEALEGGAPQTAFLRFGDRIRIEMIGGDGMSVFGAIEQQVAAR